MKKEIPTIRIGHADDIKKAGGGGYLDSNAVGLLDDLIDLDRTVGHIEAIACSIKRKRISRELDMVRLNELGEEPKFFNDVLHKLKKAEAHLDEVRDLIFSAACDWPVMLYPEDKKLFEKHSRDVINIMLRNFMDNSTSEFIRHGNKGNN